MAFLFWWAFLWRIHITWQRDALVHICDSHSIFKSKYIWTKRFFTPFSPPSQHKVKKHFQPVNWKSSCCSILKIAHRLRRTCLVHNLSLEALTLMNFSFVSPHWAEPNVNTKLFDSVYKFNRRNFIFRNGKYLATFTLPFHHDICIFFRYICKTFTKYFTRTLDIHISYLEKGVNLPRSEADLVPKNLPTPSVSGYATTEG